MNKIGTYEVELVNISPKQWDNFLREHSNLPGARANRELARAFARTGTLMDFKKYIHLDPDKAPENTPDEFLTYCGVMGFGQYLSKYHDGGLLILLKERANDPRWRIREAVVLALQIVGQKKISRLIAYAKSWIEGTFPEQRAAVAAMCDSDLLSNRETCLAALELLDWATATMIEYDDRQNEGEYQELQEALNFCWSVAVAASPEKGKPMMERWFKENHPVVNKIMKNNLEKDQLKNTDSEWVKRSLKRLSK